MVDPKAKAGYEMLAQKALNMQTTGPGDHSQMPMELLTKEFQNLLADSDTWYAELKANEIRWIREGKNADAEFGRLYPKEPVVIDSREESRQATA